MRTDDLRERAYHICDEETEDMLRGAADHIDALNARLREIERICNEENEHTGETWSSMIENINRVARGVRPAKANRND